MPDVYPGRSRYVVLASLCLVLFSAAVSAEETRIYDWITAGEVSGKQVMTIGDDGVRISDFEFNDRGRGPKLHEVIQTDGNGLPVSLQVSGHSYMGAPAEERYFVEDGIGRWRSTLETGEAAGSAYYVANDGSPEQTAHTAFDSGEVIGPRSIAAGFIDGKSPFSAPTPSLAETLEQAQAMVRDYAAEGFPQIKIYSSIDPAWVQPLAEEIHGSGMRLSGHIPSYMTAQQAVIDGFDEIQHISLLKEHGVVIDPTVSVFDSMLRHRSGELDPSYAMVAGHLPNSVRRSMLAGDLDIDDTNAARYARSADALLEMIAKLHAAGVPLVA